MWSQAQVRHCPRPARPLHLTSPREASCRPAECEKRPLCFSPLPVVASLSAGVPVSSCYHVKLVVPGDDDDREVPEGGRGEVHQLVQGFCRACRGGENTSPSHKLVEPISLWGDGWACPVSPKTTEWPFLYLCHGQLAIISDSFSCFTCTIKCRRSSPD